MWPQVAGSASLEGWDGDEGWAPFSVSSVLPQAGEFGSGSERFLPFSPSC